jgi:predicted oxidoreductase
MSRIVQGFWRLTDWHWDTETLAEFMRDCIARGVTTFDTAEIYGNTVCETEMGKVFEKHPEIRQQIQLVTKTGIRKIAGMPYGDGKVVKIAKHYDTRYETIKEACRDSIERLHCDYIDLYLIHREDPLIDPWETGRALLDLKKEGLVREIGVSNFDPFKFEALNKAVEGQLVTNQIEWNPLCYEHFKSCMIDFLSGNRIHPMIWSPLAGGRIFKETDDEICTAARAKIEEIAGRHGVSPATIIYAWILYHPVGAVALVGSSKLERLDLAIQALDVQLEHTEWFEIYAAGGQQIR